MGSAECWVVGLEGELVVGAEEVDNECSPVGAAVAVLVVKCSDVAVAVAVVVAGVDVVVVVVAKSAVVVGLVVAVAVVVLVVGRVAVVVVVVVSAGSCQSLVISNRTTVADFSKCSSLIRSTASALSSALKPSAVSAKENSKYF